MKQIYSAFAKAQSQFNKALKDSKNPHFKSSYANIESVIDAISPALKANGLAFLQPISSTENKWFIQTILIHESGEKIESPLVEMIIQDKTNPQKFGSSQTYFRRYSLLAFFGIPDTDDDGNEASSSSHKVQAKPIPQPQPQKLILHFNEFVFLKGKYEGKRFADIHIDELKNYMNFLAEKYSQQEPNPDSEKLFELYNEYVKSLENR